MSAGTSGIASLDRTHDAQARSWLASAQDEATDSPIQNLPVSIFGGLLEAADRDRGEQFLLAFEVPRSQHRYQSKSTLLL